jgi:signal transduction histidine kinase
LISLRWKLAGALLLVVIVTVGVMAFLINRNTSTELRQYIQSESIVHNQRIVNALEDYYGSYQDWEGVEDVLNALLRVDIERIILADANDMVVADTEGDFIGQPASEIDINGNQIVIDGQNVGSVYIYQDTVLFGSPGRGPMGGKVQPGTTGQDTVNIIETSREDLLASINRYLWIAGAIAAAAALLLGILVTRQITRPLKELSFGAEQIAIGNLRYRVKSRTRDELGQVAESFNEMAFKLDNSEQARKRLIGDVSHELKTPLTIIDGTVNGIIDGVLPVDEEHLNTIKEQTGLLNEIINDLRDLSMAEAGTLKLDLQTVNMVDLLMSKISQFEPEAKEKNIKIKFKSGGKIPEVKVDRRRIDQILSNLLSNALRHTSEGGQITMGTRYLAAEAGETHDSLIVAVEDNGEGIPEEHLPHIFDRFYRIENARSRKGGGTGLGLAIVNQMVQAHGGRVWVQSEVGKGSTFFFSIPVKENS